VEFRRKVLDLVESGQALAEVATVPGISEQTIYLSTILQSTCR
jgi:hypothetical protein